MSLNFEALFIALAFILPGFLTSRLIAAKIPVVGKDSSAFVATSESLLRSLYIQLITLPATLLLFSYVFALITVDDLSNILQSGSQPYAVAHPLRAIAVFLVWVFLSLVIASFFGYYFDPLHTLYQKLNKSVGVQLEDSWAQLRQHADKMRKDNRPNYQFWVQARLKNGCVYQGEFAFISFINESKNRELLLRNVSFIPAATDNKAAMVSAIHCDAVFLDTENCDSIEVMFTNTSELDISSGS